MTVLLAAVTFVNIEKIALFIVMLSVLIVLHEYGHFLIARLSKVRVLEFAVGMGPLIAGWKSRPGMLGLRWAFTQPHQQSWMTDGTMDWVWPACEKAQIPVALMASNYLPQVAQIAGRHPGLKLIVDHFGRARGGKDDAAFSNIEQVAALAKFPNVALKATGAPGESSEPYPYRNIHKHIRRLYDAFGPERFFWGTDITRMPCSYRQCVTMFTEELPWLQSKDKELVMGRAMCNWLGWKHPALA